MADDVAKMLTGRHKLRIGDSFAPVSRYSYHALRYDFKPASIDPNSPSTLTVSGNEVTVTSEISLGDRSQTTVFKGNKRPCQKEGILIFDPATGECTLERLNTILQVKKSRDAAPRALPQANALSESSLDSSPKHSGASERKQLTVGASKQVDVKRAGPSSASASGIKKPSPGHIGSSGPVKASQPAAQSRVSAPSGRINILEVDLNLSESSSEDDN